jgi:RNA polymerase sigma-70 factor (ECF subfamily)
MLQALAIPLPASAPVTLAVDHARLLGGLYRDHASAIFRALRRWGVPDRHVDDALQETFLIASRKLGEFEGRSTHLTWLFGIALRVARGVRRKRALETVEDWDGVDARSGADEQLDARRAAAQLDRLLSELDESQREVFVLAELEELSAPEIAEITGAKLNTVYSRLRLARQAVQAAFAQSKESP